MGVRPPHFPDSEEPFSIHITTLSPVADVLPLLLLLSNSLLAVVLPLLPLGDGGEKKREQL